MTQSHPGLIFFRFQWQLVQALVCRNRFVTEIAQIVTDDSRTSTEKAKPIDFIGIIIRPLLAHFLLQRRRV